MKSWVRRIGFGVAVWAILYAASIPLLGLNASDPLAFKAIMACLGSLIGGAAAALYFIAIEQHYLRDAVITAITWMVSNWLLDYVALLPFTHEAVPQYFMHIGVEYIGMFGSLLAIGYLLDKKLRAVPHV